MSETGRFLQARRVGLFAGLAILFWVLSWAYHMWGVDPPVAHDKDFGKGFAKVRTAWAAERAWTWFPVSAGVALVFTQCFVFAVFLRRSQYLRRPEALALGELFPGAVGFSVAGALLVAGFQLVFLGDAREIAERLERPGPRLEMPGYKAPLPQVLREGVEKYYAGKYEEAIKALRRVLEDFPNHLLARTYLDYALRDQADRVAKARNPYAGELAQFQDGYRAYNRGDYLVAMTRFSDVLQRLPDHKLAQEYLKKAREAQERQRAGGKAGNEKGLAVRLDLAVKEGIALYGRQQWWAAWEVMQAVVMLDPHVENARKYLEMAEAQIRRTDFLLAEFLFLHQHPCRRGILVPVADGRYLAADWLYRRGDDLYARGVRFVELDQARRPRRVVEAQYAKWIGERPALRDVTVRAVAADGATRAERLPYLFYEATGDPALLWAAAGFLGDGTLPDLGVAASFADWLAARGFQAERVRLTAVAEFAFPVAAFVLGIAAIGIGWRYREIDGKKRPGTVALLVFLGPFVCWILLATLANLLVGVGLACSWSPLLLWLGPVLAALALAGGTAWLVSRTA